jgi:hypothetical protein
VPPNTVVMTPWPRHTHHRIARVVCYAAYAIAWHWAGGDPQLRRLGKEDALGSNTSLWALEPRAWRHGMTYHTQHHGASAGLRLWLCTVQSQWRGSGGSLAVGDDPWRVSSGTGLWLSQRPTWRGSGEAGGTMGSPGAICYAA